MIFIDQIRQAFARFVPVHIRDPFGLVQRMLRSRKPAALFTLWLTVLGILLLPIDMVMGLFERRLCAREDSASANSGPFIIVCGPARSGTTLVYQVLTSALDVAYVRNFTVMFSRSPILASRWFSRQNKPMSPPGFDNYYGKTAGMQAPSEANHLWSQWVDTDESGFRTRLHRRGAVAMCRFFQQFSAAHQLPVVVKNNNANAFAATIAEHLDNCYFICLKRDAVYLAQSLIRARVEINGDVSQSYGVVDTQREDAMIMDPVTEVVQQVRYLNALAERQQEKLGQDRFWIIDYESFCDNPGSLVARVQREIFKLSETQPCNRVINPIANTNHEKDPVMLDNIRRAMQQDAADLI